MRSTIQAYCTEQKEALPTLKVETYSTEKTRELRQPSGRDGYDQFEPRLYLQTVDRPTYTTRYHLQVVTNRVPFLPEDKNERRSTVRTSLACSTDCREARGPPLT